MACINDKNSSDEWQQRMKMQDEQQLILLANKQAIREKALNWKKSSRRAAKKDQPMRNKTPTNSDLPNDENSPFTSANILISPPPKITLITPTKTHPSRNDEHSPKTSSSSVSSSPKPIKTSEKRSALDSPDDAIIPIPNHTDIIAVTNDSPTECIKPLAVVTSSSAITPAFVSPQSTAITRKAVEASIYRKQKQRKKRIQEPLPITPPPPAINRLSTSYTTTTKPSQEQKSPSLVTDFSSIPTSRCMTSSPAAVQPKQLRLEDDDGEHVMDSKTEFPTIETDKTPWDENVVNISSIGQDENSTHNMSSSSTSSKLPNEEAGDALFNSLIVYAEEKKDNHHHTDNNYNNNSLESGDVFDNLNESDINEVKDGKKEKKDIDIRTTLNSLNLLDETIKSNFAEEDCSTINNVDWEVMPTSLATCSYILSEFMNSKEMIADSTAAKGCIQQENNKNYTEDLLLLEEEVAGIWTDEDISLQIQKTFSLKEEENVVKPSVSAHVSSCKEIRTNYSSLPILPSESINSFSGVEKKPVAEEGTVDNSILRFPFVGIESPKSKSIIDNVVNKFAFLFACGPGKPKGEFSEEQLVQVQQIPSSSQNVEATENASRGEISVGTSIGSAI